MASASYSTPSKKPKTDAITGLVRNCTGHIIKSPSKSNNKHATEWFEFCLLSRGVKRRVVSFCPQHHVPINSVSGSISHGIKITNIDMSSDDIRLQASTLLEIVEVSVDEHSGPVKTTTSIENVLLKAPMKSLVTVVGKVVQIQQYSTAKCTVHKMTVNDDSNRSILITSFTEVAVNQGRSYRFEDVEITEYRNNKQLSYGVKSELVPIHDDENDGEGDEPEEEQEEIYERVTITSFTPGSVQRSCEECSQAFHDSPPQIYVCTQCKHVSRTCCENSTLGEMTVIDEQRLRIILKFQDLMLTELFAVNSIDKNLPMEKYLEIMSTSFKITAKGGHATKIERL